MTEDQTRGDTAMMAALKAHAAGALLDRPAMAMRQAELGLARWKARFLELGEQLQHAMPASERRVVELRGELALLAITDATDTPECIDVVVLELAMDAAYAVTFRRQMAAMATYRQERRAQLVGELAEAQQ